jgi:hypothetical protein
VALVRADVSEEDITIIIKLTKIGWLGTTLAVTINRSTLPVTTNVVPSQPIIANMMVIPSSETSVLTRATRRNIPENGILHSERSENLKSYIALTGWAMYRRRNMSPVRYELGSYIPEDRILHSRRHKNLKSYITLTGWAM